MARIRSHAIVAETHGPRLIEVRVIEAATLIGRYWYTPEEVSQLVEHLQLAVAQSVAGKYTGNDPLPRSALPK